MKERQILFSGPMVRAILEDRKTQTRRVMKPQPEPVNFDDRTLGFRLPGEVSVPVGMTNLHLSTLVACNTLPLCPHGVPGDRLWVKETWGFTAGWPMGSQRQHVADRMPWFIGSMAYRADRPEGNWCWRPSIHMPRLYSRIALEVTKVRVERIRDISDADAAAEGVEPQEWDGCPVPDHTGPYQVLWDSINGKRNGGQYSWTANPWVWAIDFRRIA
jgi:hypothetical protein